MLARWLRFDGGLLYMVEPSFQPKRPLNISRDLAFRVVVSSLALLTVYLLLLRNVAGFDLWGSLAFGALIDQVGFPGTDVFSYTAAGSPWVDHSWGAAVFFLRLLRDGGSSALFVLKVLLFVTALSTAATLHRAATTERETSLADAIFFLAGLPCCYLLLDFYTPSATTASFSILGFLAVLWILDTYRRSPSTRAPWLLPPVVALWINLDSGFLLAFFAIAVHLWWLVHERRQQQATELAIITLFCIGATLLNPYGWRYVPHVVEVWTAASSTLGDGGVFGNGPVFAWTYAALAASTLSATAVNTWHDRRFPGELLLLLPTAVGGWLHIGLVPFFVFAALALGVPEVLRLVEHYNVPRRARDYVGLVIPAGLGAASIILITLRLISIGGELQPRVPGWNAMVSRPDTDRYYPLGAVAYLNEQPGAMNLWSPVDWGDFVTWRLYPKVRVSIDGRYGTIYSGAVRDDQVRFWGPRRDVSVADNYDTTHILVRVADSASLAALDASPWARIYEDPIAVLYGRRAPEVMPAARGNDSVLVDDIIGDLGRFNAATR